jgi:hypothetical protein
VALGGLAVLVGSFGTWDICPKFPCEGAFGFFALADRSGIGIGPGVVTAELGLLLAAVGTLAYRRRGMSPFRIEAIALALLALLAVGAYVVRTYLFPEFFTYGPELSFYLVVGGAALAALASARLHPPDRATRMWALLRRLPLALLITGTAVWALAVNGHLGLYVEPLTYAVVLISLGIGLWPGPLLGSRVSPPKVGLLIVLYGIVSLTAIVFGGFALELLAGMPIVVLVALVVLVLPAVLELPTETPRAGSATGRIDKTLASVGSISGLLVAALLLTGATMALLIVRLLATRGWFRELFLIDGTPDDPTWLVWLLVAGLAIGVGIAIAIRRRPARRTLAAHPVSAGDRA